jgi:WD40 repeat protein
VTGQNFVITNADTIFNGGPFTDPWHDLRHSWGVWLNDRYIMAKFDALYTGGLDFIPLFDIQARTFRDLGVVTGLPGAFDNNQGATNSISPNRDYLWASPGAQSPADPQVYLVDLRTLQSRLYHAASVDWSILDQQVLTLSDQTLRPLPAIPDFAELHYWIADAWHPTQGARLSIYADRQEHQYLYLLDFESLSYRHLALPSNFDGGYGRGTSIVWSPDGDRFALAAPDGSLWQMDFPKMEHLEQLTPPMANVRDISWSPDGAYLSFVGGTDIYIVDAGSDP